METCVRVRLHVHPGKDGTLFSRDQVAPFGDLAMLRLYLCSCLCCDFMCPGHTAVSLQQLHPLVQLCMNMHAYFCMCARLYAI